MFFKLIRLAVRLATQPFSNVIRALAMSGLSLTTATPLACTFFTGDPTTVSTMSMSWIIRSSTTLTSVPRGLNCARRCVSMNMGRSKWGSAARKAGLKRSTWPICTFTPLLRASSTRSSASSIVLASGFSMNTCLPAFIASEADRWCVIVGVTISTASAFAINSAGSGKAGTPNSASITLQRSASISWKPITSHSASSFSCWICMRPR